MTVETEDIEINIQAEYKDFVVLSVIPGDNFRPIGLKHLDGRNFLSLVDTRRGVILDGDLPEWLSCFLTYQYRIVSWLAIRRADGLGVVVFSHDKRYSVGMILDWEWMGKHGTTN